MTIFNYHFIIIIVVVVVVVVACVCVHGVAQKSTCQGQFSPSTL